eukprot:TRINITY_DN14456_c0_g2_i1.p1 TRINITY_DN14456_c0_g2~~TRINITY_DN14456_c0_g2_i1.p1  ORF type:complete len:248 (+),score=31.68 TRINITY_DN14456_c0_g2_i1:112-855(+)
MKSSSGGIYAIEERVLTISHDAQSCDVCVEQRPESRFDGADGTNARLWPTSVVMARYLCANPGLIRNKRVVELGAGAGTVGLVCAALGASHVCITDVPGALPLIADNLDRNPSLKSSGAVTVAPCTWGERAHIDAVLALGGKYDVVLACEVVYKQEEDVLQALVETQDLLLSDASDAQIMLAYEFRSNLVEDFAYFGPASDRFEVEQITLREFELEFAGDQGDEDGRLLYRYTRRTQADTVKANQGS